MDDGTEQTVEPTDEIWGPLELGRQDLPLDAIRPAARNPRRGAVGKVVESLREFGQHRPVVVQQSSREVIVGNHLYKAARLLGWVEIDALVVDDDDKKALRRAIADNAVGDHAGWDKTELAEVMKEVGEVPGFDQADINKLIAGLDKTPDSDNPSFPLVPMLNEQYECVLVFAKNATDWAWLETTFDLRKERSYKSVAVKRSHVVTVERLQALFGEKAGGS